MVSSFQVTFRISVGLTGFSSQADGTDGEHQEQQR